MLYSKFWFLSSGVTSNLEQGTDQPEKADRLREDDHISGANCYAGRGGSPRYSKPRSYFLKPIEFTQRKVSAEAGGSESVAVGRQLAMTIVRKGNVANALPIARSIKCHDVQTMKFRRDAIFYDRVLLALCVGTAIFGLVALILLD